MQAVATGIKRVVLREGATIPVQLKQEYRMIITGGYQLYELAHGMEDQKDKEGALASALATFRRAVTLDSTHPAGFIAMGVVLRAMGRYADACEAAVDAADRSNRDYGRAWCAILHAPPSMQQHPPDHYPQLSFARPSQ